jgi:hypothetical protein
MLDNVLILSIGAVLATISLIVWILLASSSVPSRLLLIAAVYAAIFGAVQSLAGDKAAFAVIMLGLIFTALCKLAKLNFNMVHTANYPKHRRCY